MSPSPLPGVSPLVAISKSSSSSQSPLHHQQSSQHNLPIPSTSYNLTPPLNNIPKLSNTIIKQQQQNLILNSPKMIVQNDKNLDISDSSSIGSNINKISNIPDITAKEISSLEESILLNPSNNNNNIVNNNNNNNNNDELNDDKNQLISDIKIKKENNDKKNSSNTINDNKDKQQENDKDESNNNKKEDEKSIITFDVSKKREIFLKNLNKHIICNLCQGYLIDATTIVECLHSFCHSCIMKHLRTEQYCPRCEMMINTAKPNIKPDTTLQAIVYKIVPGLYEKELMRKRAFYRDRPKDAAKATPEQRGEDTEHLIFSPTENMSLSLEYADLTEIPSSSDDIYGLNTPKYLQCPASLTVAHLKKFVLMKFAIDSELFMVEIMYKVKTIVLYDHYTLMDVAYIYTWKRDAPMRFFFRVKETDNYAIKLDKLKRRNPVIKNEININNNSTSLATNNINCSSTTTNDDPKLQNFEKSKIKIEPQESNKLAYDMNKKFEIVQSPKSTNSSETQKTEKIKITLVGKNKYPKITSPNNQDKLIKNDLQQQQKPIKSIKNSELIYHQKITTNNNYGSNNVEQQPERKPENIKMKIDISKQDSIKIINMSGPDSMPKEIVKSVKPEKEWKIKIKKEDKHSLTNPKTSPKDSDNKRQRKNNLSPLTVPPITIKAEKLSPIQKSYIKSLSPSSSKSKDKTSSSKIVIGEKDEEEKKSEFLNSFALTPIKNISPEKYIKNKTNNLPEIKVVPTKNLMGPPLKPVAVSKRKTKEPIKSTNSKKPKFDFADILTPENFTKKRIEKEQQIVKQQPKEMISFGLSPYPIGGNNSNNNNNNNSNNNTNSNTNTNNNCDVLINGKPLHKFNNDDKLMPAPPPLKALDTIKKNGIKKPQNNNDNNKNMKFPMTTNKQHNKLLQNNRNQHHIAQPGSTTPHPMIPSGIASSKAAMAATPGNRTPITTKRYPSILPKHQSIINPFANIPNEVNKILQDSGTEIKHITPNEDGSNSIKVYGPSMNIPSSSTQKLPINQPQQMPTTNNINKNTSINKTSTNNHSYLNYALYNASKTRGNEVPPGCRTPMYTPNSPIYSPNSPQYIPNYNIPIQPTYKYAPKSAATTNVNSYLQNVLGQNKQMSGLFPGPPVKKSDDNNMIMKKSVSPTTTPTTNNNFETDAKKLNQNENNNKLNYPPFSKTPPNNEKTNKNEPEKQIKVKSLLNSCNINIPSSLSITITNEDNDSKSNNSLNPKHKSPVNNYIEILKLPDQTLQEQIIEQQQQQQQQQQQNQVKDETTTPTKKKDNELSNISSTTCNNTKKNSSGNTKTVMTMNTPRSSPMPFINSTTKTITSPTTNTCTPTSTPPIITAPPIITTNKLIPSEKKLTETPKKSPIETPKENKSIGNTKIGQNIDKNNTINKKTPSPDKKSPSPINDTKKRPNSDKKSSPENGTKSIKTDITQQQPPTKKFRHILPRAPIATQSQNISNNKQNIQSSTNLPKPNTKNLQIQQQQQQLSQQNQKPSQNIVGGIRTNFPNTSNGCIIGVKTNQQISTNKNNNNNNNLKKNDGNFLNALMKSPITSIQQQQSPHSINLNNNNSMIDNSLQQTVSSSSNNIQRPNSTDMANFFNETILRAAAVNAANVAAVNNSNNGNNSGGPQSNTSSNIFLPQLAAAAAANFGQFAPINFNPYNFQQAIVLEQYARYKAGQDALEKFAQNLKNSNNANKNNSNSPKGSILNGSSSNNNNAVSDGVTGSTGTK